MENSEESTNDKTSKYEKYLEYYFPRPSNQRDCIMEIVRETWGLGETLGEYGPDYIQDWIDIEWGEDSADPADIIDSKIVVYQEVDRSIHEDVVDFRNGCFHFLKAFYQQKERVIELIENDDVLNNVIKVISIIEVCLEKLEGTLLDYEAALCYAMYGGDLEELERYRGKNAVKRFKKYDELTPEEYESAFREITEFMSYINKNEFGSRLMELGARLNVFCKMKTDDSEKEEPKTKDKYQRPVTLMKFMQRYCEKQTIKLLRYRRKSLNDAHFRKSIILPEPTRNWKTGQAKYYNPSDLKQKWTNFCEILPNLPPLKQTN